MSSAATNAEKKTGGVNEGWRGARRRKISTCGVLAAALAEAAKARMKQGADFGLDGGIYLSPHSLSLCLRAYILATVESKAG